ncbi:cysteine-rich motor neuron 1 protein [Fopius arisanus]|uniref:Cysteine-rich motor neuron 1 protein n=1 Tax=Fopius arisanus TaxID=64838 RepID=A0A9R1U8J4_9HYME|nr:PREDICTED: cysteine-rich motor neuron 1 protein-like [Fopius arisanus]
MHTAFCSVCLSDVEEKKIAGVHGILCPEDSVPTENGECRCISSCPPNKCTQGERPIQVRAASPDTPGSCCPIYNCIPSEPLSWDDADDSHLLKGCVDHSGIPRAIGDRWDQNPCVNCTCEESNEGGSVSCYATMCKSCQNPVPTLPGECCPRCHDSRNDTISKSNTSTTVPFVVPISECKSLENCQLPCHLGAEDDDGCPICQCPEATQTTTGPDPTDKICPELPHCGLNCVLVKDQGGCPVCACEDSIESDVSVIPANVPPPNQGEDDGGIVCPELKCDLHCERGLIMDQNDCTVCQCKPHATGCPTISGCRKKCPYGYKFNRRGCLTCRCRSTCTDHQNETHPEGSAWQPDVCTSCTCDTLGRLICKETVCSIACSNPLPPKLGTCCPVCPISENPNSEPQVSRSWGIIPITLIAVLTLLVVLLMIYVIRGRFRGRLSPSTTIYSSYPAQYYKCVPAYDTPVHRSEKVVPL